MMVVVQVMQFRRLHMVNALLKLLDEVARLAALSGHCRCPSGRPPEAALPLFGPARGRHWRLGLFVKCRTSDNKALELSGAVLIFSAGEASKIPVFVQPYSEA